MTEQVGTKTKWQIAVEAISALTVTYKGKVHFGLTLFPDTTGAHCSQDAIPIPVGPGKESAIQALLTASLASSDSNFPNGPCVTNIDTGIQQAATDPALTEVGRKSYVLLLTDGRQAGCNLAGGDTGTTKIIKDLNAQKGVLTFVIGFGAGVDPAQMNTFAEAGGVANNDPTTKYYKAEDQVSLEAALAKIGNRTLSCTYNLTQVPPDPSTLFVFFENTHQILRDATHHGGWDYEPSKNQVTFYGAECDQLRQGAVSDLDIVFGCPVPGIN